jgi:hypothetical protein
MFHNMLCVAVLSCSCLLAGVVPAACTGFVQHAEAALVQPARSVRSKHIATGAQMSASKLRRFL